MSEIRERLEAVASYCAVHNMYQYTATANDAAELIESLRAEITRLTDERDAARENTTERLSDIADHLAGATGLTDADCLMIADALALTEETSGG